MDRRDFIKSGLVTLAGLSLAKGSSPTKKTNAEKYFSRDKAQNFNGLPEVPYLKEAYTPANSEIQIYSNQIHNFPQFKGKTIIQRRYVNASKQKRVKFEPDADYAKKYGEQSHISIDHAKAFFGFEELDDIKTRFITPRKAEELVLLQDPLNIYLLGKLSERKTIKYDVKTSDGQEIPIWVSSNQSLNGELQTNITLPNDEGGYTFKNDFSSAIFMATGDASIGGLVSTPVTEFIHQGFRRTANDQFNEATKDMPLDHEAFSKVLQRVQNQDEIFVHGLSHLWLEQYNKDRDLGIPESYLKGYIRDSEVSAPQYKSLSKMFERIKSLGPQKSRELYINNDEELFSGITN